MARKKPKKPKSIKYPKKPKQSAPLSSWERYDARCKEVEKRNRQREADYKKGISQIESDKKKKAQLVRKWAK